MPENENPNNEVWKSPSLTAKYLTGVRGGIPLAAEQIDVMLRLIDARAQPVQAFLDLGCGDGVLANALLDRFPQARGTLLDFSEPMLEAAKNRLAALAGQLDFQLADYSHDGWTRPLFPSAPFDVVVSGFSIHHQPDERKQAIYHDVHSLLKPGGLFLNIEHVSSPTLWLEAIYDDRIIDALHDFNQRQGSNDTREQVAREFCGRDDRDANILAPVETQCQWLREIGFEDVDCYFKLFELAVFGGRRGPAL